jgi:hypothetical protein
MNKTVKITILLFALVSASLFTVSNFSKPFSIESAKASPALVYNSRPSNYTFSSGVFSRFPDRAYDGANGTNKYAFWAHTRGPTSGYGTSNGYIEFNIFGPRADPPRGSTITQVDLHVVFYLVQQTADTTATMYLNYRVNPSTTNQSLQSWTRAQLTSTTWFNRTYTNIAEPNGGGWTWEDLANLKLRFNRQSTAAASQGTMQIHEIWATVTYEPTQIVAISPKAQSPIPSQVKINVTGIEELYGFEFKMTYNTTAITVTSVSLGPYLNTTAGGTANTFGRLIKLNDTAGFVWATQTMTGNRRGGNVLSGTWVTLATINIATQSGGPTNLNFEVKLAGHNYLIKKAYPGSFTLIQPGHDAAVTNVIAAPTSVTRGDNVAITVTVKNEGDYVETFYVSAYANTSAGETLIETKTVTNLARGATQGVPFTWNTRDFGSTNYTVSGKTTLRGVVDVDSTDDRKYYSTLIEVNPRFGDIDDDGWVDVGDIAAINFAWGAQPGDLLYNLRADVNADGIINAEDLALVGHAWDPSP